jgi:hypothetical protein
LGISSIDGIDVYVPARLIAYTTSSASDEQRHRRADRRTQRDKRAAVAGRASRVRECLLTHQDANHTSCGQTVRALDHDAVARFHRIG